jgi:predicted transcriptional regulator
MQNGVIMSQADELRQLRLAKRLTQQEVADKMKVSQSYYAAIEAGRRRSDIGWAMQTINRMRLRGNRTGGGEQKAGRRVG